MHVYLPQIYGPKTMPPPSDKAEQFVALWFALPEMRQRPMRWDKRLKSAAQQQAVYLASRPPDELANDPDPHTWRDGTTANLRVRATGYRLLGWHGDGNTVESATMGTDDAAESLRLLLASPAHRPHLLAQGWYSDHRYYGIGYVPNHYVFVSCPPEEMSA